MSNSLCDVWQQLLAHPSDDAAISRARTQLRDILDHVSECDACGAATDAANDHGEAIFEALGLADDQLTEAEQRELEEIDRRWARNEQEIEEAVNEVLLNSVSFELSREWREMQRLSGSPPKIRHLDVFLATNALNLLIHSRASRHSEESFALTKAGLLEGNKLAVSRQDLVIHMMRHAPAMSQPVASAMFDWTLKVAAAVPKLFLQFESTQRRDGGVSLHLDTPSLQHDLNKRWLPKAAIPAGSLGTDPGPRPTSQQTTPSPVSRWAPPAGKS